MPATDLQTTLLVIQDLALLVTIIGWIVTGAQQRSLLKETRQAQRVDRDLAVFRARMDSASKLTASLIRSSDQWYKLSSLARAALDARVPKEFFSQGLPLIAEAAKTKLHIALILYDPQYRTLRDLMREDVAKRLYDNLKASSQRTAEFHSRVYELAPDHPEIEAELAYISEESQNIGDDLTDVANGFADAFAALDRRLTEA